ncbi:Fis family transcriptional regulator [Paraburkholderia aspalathi]|uniref:Fis family transcriptional regulator n=1 Tax=Paraburkholderia aspalathi TaxID=1324617 RepID=UPI0038BA89C4
MLDPYNIGVCAELEIIAGMPVSKKTVSSRKAVQSRQSKRLFLPLARENAEKVVLRCRMALESIRRGDGDRTAADLMASTLLLTTFLTEAGHGLLPMSLLEETERMLFDTLNTGVQTGVWVFAEPLIRSLMTVVNEHDRQLRETRLRVVIEASARLDRYIDRQKAGAA